MMISECGVCFSVDGFNMNAIEYLTTLCFAMALAPNKHRSGLHLLDEAMKRFDKAGCKSQFNMLAYQLDNNPKDMLPLLNKYSRSINKK